MKPIGKVSHYYDKAGVAIIELQDTLKIGDRIRIERGENVFEQGVSSMQVDYKPVEKAGKGDTVGIKIDQRAKEGSLVLLLE
ncbi:MAG: translation elongation factor-like protein [Parcubacteria group bacterium]|nr:translation elongation factor-like protein [Parcubacteria group bacterium]